MGRLRPWLQLMRLPAVFTAMADIFLGFLLNHTSFADAPTAFALLLVASSCLYLAGMVFNDVFDRRLDAIERPERPIPSGRVPIGGAVALGCLLLAGGLAASALMGFPSLSIAAGLTACILAYDAALKPTPLGPIAMGGCRFLNVMLGASAHRHALFVWGTNIGAWPVAAALGIYIAGVTWFARRESAISSRGQLLGAMGVINIGYAALIAYIVQRPAAVIGDPPVELGFPVLVVLAAIILITNRRLARVAVDPVPQKVQGAVKTLLLSYVVLCATLVFFKTGEAGLAIATAALLLPAMYLGRWLSIT